MIHLLHCKGLSILEQLRLEEALLRTDDRNFFLINEGSTPSIVMGISGQVDELVDRKKAEAQAVPVIKRFSGGGTVVVDERTLFTTFIGQKNLLHPFACYPEPILRWSAEFYRAAFALPEFDLRENDFILGVKKCGGNAQYIQKERWLLHTSFLYDFCPSKMDLLLHPKKTPQYREGRAHADFVCRLIDFFPDLATLVSQIKQELFRRFDVREVSLEDVIPALEREHRRSTTIMDRRNLCSANG